MGEWAYNPITGNLDRVGDGGGGGGNITISGDSGPPLFSNTFSIVGQEANDTPVMDVDTSTGDVVIANNTWETQYVVDPSTTAGLKGTYTTVQDAVDAAFADGSASSPLYANIMLRPADYDLSALVIPDGGNFHIYGVMPSTENTNCGVRINGVGAATFDSASQIMFENLLFTDAPTFGVNSQSLTFVNVGIANGAVFNGGFPLFINSQCFGGGGITINDTLGSFQARNTFFNANITFNVTTNTNFNFVVNDCKFEGLLGTCVGNLKMFGSPFVAISADCSTGLDAQNLIIDCSNVTANGISPVPSISGSGEFYVAGMSGYTYGPDAIIFNVSSTQGNVIASKVVSADYEATIYDYYIGVDDTSATRTITLPDPSDSLIRLSLNQAFVIKDESLAASVNNIIINTNGGLIDGQASVLISNSGSSMTLKSDGVNYWTMPGPQNSALECFSSYLGSPQANVTGDGTIIPLVCDGIINNTSSSYNPATGVYTCSRAGIYVFQHSICFYGGDATNDSFLTLWNGSQYSIRAFQTGGFTPTNATVIYTAITPPINMAPGDTMAVSVVSGGSPTKNVGLYGAVPSTFNTTCTFGGWRLG